MPNKNYNVNDFLLYERHLQRVKNSIEMSGFRSNVTGNKLSLVFNLNIKKNANEVTIEEK